jgi:hypothetical protein
MNKSRSVDEILNEVRETYLEQRRLDAERKINDAVLVPFRRRDNELRWHVDQLTVVWPLSDPKR